MARLIIEVEVGCDPTQDDANEIAQALFMGGIRQSIVLDSTFVRTEWADTDGLGNWKDESYPASTPISCFPISSRPSLMEQILSDAGLDPDDADVTSERERTRCAACNRRRMCHTWYWTGVPGVGYSFCKTCEEA
jgi:hypothetical protein